MRARRWFTSPASDWHHYSWIDTAYTSDATNRYVYVIELSSPFAKMHERAFTSAQAYPRPVGTLVNRATTASGDLANFATSYPQGERILFVDTVTTIRVVPHVDAEYPIEIVMAMVRPKHKCEGYAHTDILTDFRLDFDQLREVNREKYEIKSIKRFKPNREDIAKREPVYKWKMRAMRECHTRTGANATGPSDWGFAGESGWYLLVFSNDPSNIDGQSYALNIQQRITWVHED